MQDAVYRASTDLPGANRIVQMHRTSQGTGSWHFGCELARDVRQDFFASEWRDDRQDEGEARITS
jgi:hypothetical protein